MYIIKQTNDTILRLSAFFTYSFLSQAKAFEQKIPLFQCVPLETVMALWQFVTIINGWENKFLSNAGRL